MGFRDRLADLVRGAPTSREVVSVSTLTAEAQMREGLASEGMNSQSMLGPSQPIAPISGYDTTPRSRDYATGYNIAARPRSHERVSFWAIKGLIESYDVAQVCIQHRIDDVRALKYSIKPAPWAEGNVDGAVAQARAFLRRPDGVLPFRAWLAKYLGDVLRYDAGAIFRERDMAGRVIGLKVIDGTTLAPLLDYYGDQPSPPAPAWVQYAQGLPWDWLDSTDLIYIPFRPRTDSPYGQAPIESVLLTANTDIRFQMFFLNDFTEGTIPEGFAGAPEGWTPDQIAAYQEAWDALLYGDEAAQHQIKWVPYGTSFTWSKDQPFDVEQAKWLERKTCAAYGVQPQDVGITDDVNRATGEVQADVQARTGTEPLANHVQDIIDSVLQDDLGLPVVFEFDTDIDKEDRLAEAQATQIYWSLGAIGTDEIRTERLQLDVDPSMPVPRGLFSPHTGFVPLGQVLAAGGTDIDPRTDAPASEALLPPVPTTVDPGQPSHVAKELTSGIEVETGVHGSPMLDDEEETVAKAAVEIETFARFVKARKRDGRWRDFTFDAVPRVLAHRLNDRGRSIIRKDAGEIVAAGLAVVAGDTGRVLMLQRGLDPSDPASGMWEFPGGHVETGEDPETAAIREWEEEVGLRLPRGSLLTGWTSSSGVYEGFVYRVDSESMLEILDRRAGMNPDDPDGDVVESVAWWTPSDLVDNPAVRAELAGDLNLVLDSLGPFMCNEGHEVRLDPSDGWQHLDGSIGHDDGTSITDHPVRVAPAGATPSPAPDGELLLAKAGGAGPKAPGDPRWSTLPIRRVIDRTVEYHAEKIAAAMESFLTPAQVETLVRSYRASTSTPGSGSSE